MRIKIYLMFIIIIYSNLFSQLSNQEKQFSLSIGGGIPFTIPLLYQFIGTNTIVNVTPVFFGSIGFCYEPKPFEWMGTTKYSISTEFAFSALKTENNDNSYSHPRMESKKYSAILWSKLFVPSLISPFVRAGIGFAKIVQTEKYGSKFLEDINIKGGSVALGFGGGVDITLSNDILVGVFSDGVVTPSNKELYRNDGTHLGTYYFGSLSIMGLRTTIKL